MMDDGLDPAFDQSDTEAGAMRSKAVSSVKVSGRRWLRIMNAVTAFPVAT